MDSFYHRIPRPSTNYANRPYHPSRTQYLNGPYHIRPNIRPQSGYHSSYGDQNRKFGNHRYQSSNHYSRYPFEPNKLLLMSTLEYGNDIPPLPNDEHLYESPACKAQLSAVGINSNQNSVTSNERLRMNMHRNYTLSKLPTRYKRDLLDTSKVLNLQSNNITQNNESIDSDLVDTNNCEAISDASLSSAEAGQITDENDVEICTNVTSSNKSVNETNHSIHSIQPSQNSTTEANNHSSIPKQDQVVRATKLKHSPQKLGKAEKGQPKSPYVYARGNILSQHFALPQITARRNNNRRNKKVPKKVEKFPTTLPKTVNAIKIDNLTSFHHNSISEDESIISESESSIISLENDSKLQENCTKMDENSVGEMTQNDSLSINNDPIHSMLEEAVDTSLKPLEYEKSVLKAIEKDEFEILPDKWMEVTHNSGMPLYFHRTLRVCTLSRPYFLGRASVRKHSIPIGSVPCLAYKRWKNRHINPTNKICTKATPEPILNKKDDQNIWNDVTILLDDTLDTVCLESGDNMQNENHQSFSQEQNHLPLVEVESVSEATQKNWIAPATLRSYCESLFEFQTITVRRFKTWADRRRHLKRLKRDHRQTLPQSAKVVKCSIPAKKLDGNMVTKKKNFFFNPEDKTVLSILHEYVQNVLKTQVTYEFVNVDNAATPFSARLSIQGVEYSVGYGSNKRNAKLHAAKLALAIVNPKIAEMYEKEKEMVDFKRQNLKLQSELKTPSQKLELITKLSKHSQSLQYNNDLLSSPPSSSLNLEKNAQNDMKTQQNQNLTSTPNLKVTSPNQNIQCCPIKRLREKNDITLCNSTENITKKFKVDTVCTPNNKIHNNNINENFNVNNTKFLKSSPKKHDMEKQNSICDINTQKSTFCHQNLDTPINMKSIKIESNANAVKDNLSRIETFTRDEWNIFNEIAICDVRITEMSVKAGIPTPYPILLECLKRNFGLTDTNIQFDLKQTKPNVLSLQMNVGQYEAKVICHSKKEGKHKASQHILQSIHPQLVYWSSILRLYGPAFSKELKARKLAEQSITSLQQQKYIFCNDKNGFDNLNNFEKSNSLPLNNNNINGGPVMNETTNFGLPNLSILAKLQEEMINLYERKNTVQTTHLIGLLPH